MQNIMSAFNFTRLNRVFSDALSESVLMSFQYIQDSTAKDSIHTLPLLHPAVTVDKLEANFS